MNYKETVISKLLRLCVIFIITFSITTLFSCIVNLSLSQEIKIGFPFVFYWEFSVRGNEFNNFSWFIDGFFLSVFFNFLLAVLLCFIIDILFSNKSKIH